MDIPRQLIRLGVFVCIATLASGGAWPAEAPPAANAEMPAVLAPYLQNPAPDGMTICLLAREATRVRVAWAPEAQGGPAGLSAEPSPESPTKGTESPASGTAIPGTPWTIWKVRLAKLEPGTEYRYRVHYDLPTGSVATPPQRFRSLDPRAKTVRFVVFNDLHDKVGTLEALLRFVRPEDYEFTILLGDCIADPSAVDGARQVFQTWDAYLRRLDAGRKPIIFVRGNHETRGDFASKMAYLFDLPLLGAAKAPEEEAWQFTLRAGPVHVLAMDTGEDDDASTPEDSYKRPKFWQAYRQRQAKWLEELAPTRPGADAAWRVFASHIPLYNPAGWTSESSRRDWEPYLLQADLDLMLAGHDHGWKYLPRGNRGSSWPVLIGGGPQPAGATVTLLSADESCLRARMLSAVDGRLLREFIAEKGESAKALEPGRSYACAKPGDGARSYVRTLRADFAKGSFQAEATLTLRGGGGAGCAFFGLGRGQADPAAYHEPSMAPSLYVRMAPDDFAGGIVTTSVDGRESKTGAVSAGDGTHRVRLSWDAATKRALFEIDADRHSERDGEAFRSDGSIVVLGASVDFEGEAHLFAGGANGVRVADFTVKELTQAEVALAGFGESFPNDPTAGTWLPAALAVAAPPDTGAKPVDELLASLGCRLRLLAVWYEGSALSASRAFVDGRVRTEGAEWTSAVRATPLPGDPSGLALECEFALARGAARSAGVAVAFDFADWSSSHYVLVPASIYDGNRSRIERRGYCTGFDEADFGKKDLPQITTELPQLSPEPEARSKFEVNSSNAATPAICVFDRRNGHAFIVLAEQGIREGTRIIDHGLAVEEDRDRSRAAVVISAPGVRERKPEFIGFSASGDRGIDWKAGDRRTLRFQVHAFETAGIPGLLDKFLSVRKAVTGPNHPRELLPFSEVARLMTQRIDGRWRSGAGHSYYGADNSEQLCLGWVGGLMNTFPMLALGDAAHRERVFQTFDFAVPAAQGKSGYFLASIDPSGRAGGRDWFPNRPIVLTRQGADVLFWMLKQFKVLEAQGHAAAIKPEWRLSVRRLAEAFADTWRRHGQWGNYVNHETGDPVIYNSTSGVMAVGGLALAADGFECPEFLLVATQAADHYYEQDFVQRGFTYGACSDILQNADAETAVALMTSLMVLHEATGEARWLERTRNVANLVATWVASYDYELPPETELGRLGARLAGTVWASTQNKHGAPGFCTSSGDPLFKLYRATGDRRYAELMRDVVRAHAEGIKPGGEITERLTYCDADSRGNRGEGSTSWNELNGFLMALELPGVYLRTDTRESFVFDHVHARIVGREGGGVTLEIANPTPHDARVSILAEGAEESRKPLGCTAFLSWPKVEVKSGASVRVDFP